MSLETLLRTFQKHQKHLKSVREKFGDRPHNHLDRAKHCEPEPTREEMTCLQTWLWENFPEKAVKIKIQNEVALHVEFDFVLSRCLTFGTPKKNTTPSGGKSETRSVKMVGTNGLTFTGFQKMKDLKAPVSLTLIPSQRKLLEIFKSHTRDNT